MEKQTKIVCTIGPSCEDVETLEKMVRAGMNVARLNFSHGTYENHAMLIKNIREVAEKTGEPVAILQDLSGPKIRIEKVAEEGINLVEGAEVIFSTDSSDKDAIQVGYKELHRFIKKGEAMFLDDGKIEVVVKEVQDKRIITKVVVAGVLFSNKGINIPKTDLTGLEVLTEKDKADAKFGVEQGVDMIALSFVMRPDDILDLRYHIKQMELELGIEPHDPIKIIAKIEKAEAVKHIKDIITVTDGIMVARGDLGVEIPAEEVPIVQKKLIDTALEHAKPVIVATQMLDSMQNNPRPTRAEVSDVANAVIDHADAVMTSGETAMGDNPVETVRTMAHILVEAEASPYDDVLFSTFKKTDMGVMARRYAEYHGCKAIVIEKSPIEVARLVSHARPELPIIFKSTEAFMRRLALYWGIDSALRPKAPHHSLYLVNGNIELN